MANKVHGLFYFLNEGNRLRNKFPSSTEVVRLSDLYPDVEREHDCALAVKKDYLGINITVFEEKTCDEVLSDGIIPISYQSEYGRCIAMAIRDFMTENSEFCKAFLGKYKKIVLDGNAVAGPGVLVIGNYSNNVSIEGYTFQNFIEAVLKPYGINSFEFPDLVHRLATNSGNKPVEGSLYSKPDFYSLLTKRCFDFEELATFFIVNKRYDDLKFLLENSQNTKKVNSHVLNTMPIEALNVFLDYVPNVISENADILKPAVDEVVLISSRWKNIGETSSTIPMSLEDSVELATLIMREIDISGRLSDSFEKTIANGTLVSFEDVKDDYVLYGKVDGKFEKKSFPRNYKFSDSININRTGTVTDVIDIVNGFMHYYIESKHGDIDGEYELVSDAVAAYYETRACQLLVQHGFPKDEMVRIQNARKADCRSMVVLDSTPIMVSLLSKKNKTGKLSMDSILSEQEVQSNARLREMKKLPPVSEENMKKRYAAGCAEMIFNSNGRYDVDLIGCALGYSMAKGDVHSEMDERMLWVADNCSSLDYEPEQLIGVLRTGDTNIRKKESTHSSRKDEMKSMFDELDRKIDYSKGDFTRK